MAIAFLALVVASWAARAGSYPLGTAYEDDASCLVPGALPTDVEVADEGPVPATAERTWFPLGFICTIHPQDRNQAALVIPHQDWPATWTSFGGLVVAAIALLATATTIRSTRSRSRRHIS